MDELDFANFRHGGANLTGFRLVDPGRRRATETGRAWSRLSPGAWPGAGRRLQLDAALAMDGVTAIVAGLSALISRTDSALFRETFRRGQVYNNGTRGIHCKPDSPVWIHGRAIMDSFKQVPEPRSQAQFVRQRKLKEYIIHKCSNMLVMCFLAVSAAS